MKWNQKINTIWYKMGPSMCYICEYWFDSSFFLLVFYLIRNRSNYQFSRIHVGSRKFQSLSACLHIHAQVLSLNRKFKLKQLLFVSYWTGTCINNLAACGGKCCWIHTKKDIYLTVVNKFLQSRRYMHVYLDIRNVWTIVRLVNVLAEAFWKDTVYNILADWF